LTIQEEERLSTLEPQAATTPSRPHCAMGLKKAKLKTGVITPDDP
jgi:hypothetical protein